MPAHWLPSLTSSPCNKAQGSVALLPCRISCPGDSVSAATDYSYCFGCLHSASPSWRYPQLLSHASWYLAVVTLQVQSHQPIIVRPPCTDSCPGANTDSNTCENQQSQVCAGDCRCHRAYVPPEASHTLGLTPAADVYQFGGTLHFMLAGRHPIDLVGVEGTVTGTAVTSLVRLYILSQSTA